MKLSLKKTLLKRLHDRGFKYIARNGNNSLFAYKNMPMKNGLDWILNDDLYDEKYDCYLKLNDEFFPEIKCDDENPTYIADYSFSLFSQEFDYENEKDQPMSTWEKIIEKISKNNKYLCFYRTIIVHIFVFLFLSIESDLQQYLKPLLTSFDVFSNDGYEKEFYIITRIWYMGLLLYCIKPGLEYLDDKFM